jgi:hypothetical protein
MAAATSDHQGAEIHCLPMFTRWDVERAVKAAKLDGPQVCIMLVLLTCTDDGTTFIPPEFSPSLTALAAATGYCKASVATHLAKLEAAQWLTRDKPATAVALRYRETTNYQPQIPPGLVHLLDRSSRWTSPARGRVQHVDGYPSSSRTSANREADETAAPDPSSSRTSPGAGHNQNNPSRPNTRPNTQRSRADYDDPQFADFWGTYPKKVGKRAAWKQWLLAVKRADPAEIITGTKRYAAQLADDGTDPKYIKDPSGWLSADRWADEPPAAPRRPASGHVPYQDPEDQSAYLEPMFPDEEDNP